MDRDVMEVARDEIVEAGFHKGVVEIEGKNAVFMDPVRVLSAGYETHEIRSECYYARDYFTVVSVPSRGEVEEGHGRERKKRKRKRKVYSPNEKEAIAESRHQEVRSAILEAHEAFEATVAPYLRKYIKFDENEKDAAVLSQDSSIAKKSGKEEVEMNFVGLAAIWQAPMYEVSFPGSTSGQAGSEQEEARRSSLFNTVVENPSRSSEVAQCGECKYLLPKLSKFLISDFSEVHELIPGVSENGYNIVVIDPPWENKSVHRKAIYPTLPNRYFLSLPVNQLAHADGALVALWITNREKLRHFAVTELFPAWGVTLAAVWYWLKVTAEGTMVSPLDLAHHRPYECLLLGFLPSKADSIIREEGVLGTDLTEQVNPPDKFVVITIPGDHSRKPPLHSILSKYIPGRRPQMGLELFARELIGGWTSWGNETLRFQHLKYFRKKAKLPLRS